MNTKLNNCPKCGCDKIVFESTACSEIQGIMYQSMWAECTNCLTACESVEVVHDSYGPDDVWVPPNYENITAEEWNKFVEEFIPE